MEEARANAERAKLAYLEALRSLIEGSCGGSGEEQLRILRQSHDDTVRAFESNYGSETFLLLQLSFFEALPVYLSSERTVQDGLTFAQSCLVDHGASEWQLLELTPYVPPNDVNQETDGTSEGSKIKRRRSTPLSEVANKEILALFFKHAKEGLSLKRLAELVAMDYDEIHGPPEHEPNTHGKMTKWWYRHFKLEHWCGLGDLKTKHGLTDTHFDEMRAYYASWKRAYDLRGTKRGPESRTESPNTSVNVGVGAASTVSSAIASSSSVSCHSTNAGNGVGIPQANASTLPTTDSSLSAAESVITDNNDLNQKDTQVSGTISAAPFLDGNPLGSNVSEDDAIVPECPVLPVDNASTVSIIDETAPEKPEVMDTETGDDSKGSRRKKRKKHSKKSKKSKKRRRKEKSKSKQSEEEQDKESDDQEDSDTGDEVGKKPSGKDNGSVTLEA